MPLPTFLSRRQCLQAAAALPLAARAAAAPAPPAADDLPLLAAVLRTLHPGIHRYLSPAGFEAALHRLEAPWQAARSTPERLLALNRFLAQLRCGHSYTNFYNQRGAVREALLAPPRLPLHFRWLGQPGQERAVVSGGASPALVGREIRRLSGQPMAAVREALLPLVRADGHNRAAALALLAPQGDDGIETFDVLHPLVYGPAPVWQLELDDGRRLALPGINAAAREAQRRPEAEHSDATPPWPLRALPDGAMLLTMPGWAMYRTKWDWRAYLKRVFEQVADARHLVIDLRGNEGGLDCGNAILARLIDRPLSTRLLERRVRYRQVPAHLNPFLDTWDEGFRDWGPGLQPVGEGFWRLPDAEGEGRIEPEGPRFRGRVSVLCDGSNHSATFGFLQLAQRHRLARLVGEPTGGNQRGLNGGAFFFLRLPGSGIEVDIPLIGSFAPPGTPDAGLQPDVLIRPTPADLAAGRDPVLQAALA